MRRYCKYILHQIEGIMGRMSNYNMRCTCGLCTYGGAKETEHAMNFLMGLNDDFSQIRCQILLMDPIPSVNLIFSLIIKEERHRCVSVSQIS